MKIDTNGIELGDKVRCKVSGFTGIATGVIQYLNGCIQILLTPKVGKDNKKIDGCWIDAPQLEVMKGEKVNVKKSSVGGPDRRQSGNGLMV